MLKKVLLIVLLGVLLAGIVGCGSAQPQPEYQFERNDLVMVNLSTTQSGPGSTGVYVFFFENYPTMRAYTYEVQIKFDASLDKPIVRAKSVRKRGTIEGVTVIFRDREQMKEYWIVK